MPTPIIVEKVRETATNDPERDALICGDKRLSYRALAERIDAAAGVLRRRGVRPGDRVVLAATSRRPSFVYGYFACHRLGAIAVPVDERVGESTLAGIVEQTEPALLCLDTVTLDALDRGDPSDQGEAEATPAGPEEVVDILFTGGTTGRPKGVMQTHRSIAAFAGSRNDAVGAGPDDRLVIPLPLCHGFGLGRLRAAMLCGATVILVDGFRSPGAIFQAFVDHRASAFCCVPSGFAALFQATGDELGEHRDRLQYLETATAPLPDGQKQRLMRLLPRTRLYNSYGLTETTSTITFVELHGAPDRLGSVGRPIPRVTLRIVDDGKEVPRGAPGQVEIAGDNVMKGYWRDPVRTSEVLVDGFYVTNDLGFLDADGYLYLTGRREEIINVGGLKVAPREVEVLLEQHPAVLSCACIGVADPAGLTGEAVMAFLVAAPGHEAKPGLDGAANGPKPRAASQPSAEELTMFLRPKVEAYKIPVRFSWIEEIPKTSVGKVHRARLRELSAAPSPERPAALDPRERARRLEDYVVEQIALVSRLPPGRVERNTPLGDLGLTSLTALELRGRLEAGLGVALPATLVWGGHGTVAELAAFVAGKLTAPPATPAPEDDGALLRLLGRIKEGADG